MQKLALISLLKLVASKIPTVNITDCSLLFKYQGVTYSGCTDADSERMPWCLLKKPIGGKVWGFCNIKTIGTYYADDQGGRRDCELTTPVKGTASVFGCYTLESSKPLTCLSGGKELPCIMENNIPQRTSNEKSTQASKPSKGTQEAKAPTEANVLALQLIVFLSILGGLILAIGVTMYLLYNSRSETKRHLLLKSQDSQKLPPSDENASTVLANSQYATSIPLNTEHVVTTTYIPTLSDELLVHPGDKVTIFKEYDDGWVQGANLTRNNTKGVFPKYCILPQEYSTDSGLISKRSSSSPSSLLV
ncbi:hypothetical protein DSO57_1009001 [Entomophthora muscae]|uniref:Uncharacterized protein n=1 Tax=Entomophthora muscae TaxID=34485 RepID=A0ACC2UGT0_9FUNG|nr:hypothetical protein DSO57_1009001 [Entomophthora muscae]